MEKKFIKLYDGLNKLDYFKEKNEDIEIKNLKKSNNFVFLFYLIF